MTRPNHIIRISALAIDLTAVPNLHHLDTSRLIVNAVAFGFAREPFASRRPRFLGETSNANDDSLEASRRERLIQAHPMRVVTLYFDRTVRELL